MSSLRKEISALRKNEHNGAVAILACIYVLLAAAFIGFSVLPKLAWLVLIPFMGVVQYYIVISGHEAVHKTLCANKSLNEFFGVLVKHS